MEQRFIGSSSVTVVLDLEQFQVSTDIASLMKEIYNDQKKIRITCYCLHDPSGNLAGALSA